MRLAQAALALSLVGTLLLLGTGPAYRMGGLALRPLFLLLGLGAIAAIGGGTLGLVAALTARQGGTTLVVALAALVIGALAAYAPLDFVRRSMTVPRIHDITTDVDDPPAFVAILPLRATARNQAEYGGPRVADAQRRHYPDLRPLDLTLSPASALERARRVGVEMEWEIVAVDGATGRLEATASTPWFGFKDDVVVRILPRDGGARIDVRSVSRVGRSDLGKNAERIREFLARMQR